MFFNGVDDSCIGFVSVFDGFSEEWVCDVEDCLEEVEGELDGCGHGFTLNGEW